MLRRVAADKNALGERCAMDRRCPYRLNIPKEPLLEGAQKFLAKVRTVTAPKLSLVSPSAQRSSIESLASALPR